MLCCRSNSRVDTGTMVFILPFVAAIVAPMLAILGMTVSMAASGGVPMPCCVLH